MKDKKAREVTEQLSKDMKYQADVWRERYWILRNDIDLILKHLNLTAETIPETRVLKSGKHFE